MKKSVRKKESWLTVKKSLERLIKRDFNYKCKDFAEGCFNCEIWDALHAVQRAAETEKMK